MASGAEYRPHERADRADDRIDADWLPGQHPACETLTPAGESPSETETVVVCAKHDEVVGALRCRVRPADGTGLNVWLHAREDFEVTAALVALADLTSATGRCMRVPAPATATGIPGPAH